MDTTKKGYPTIFIGSQTDPRDSWYSIDMVMHSTIHKDIPILSPSLKE